MKLKALLICCTILLLGLFPLAASCEDWENEDCMLCHEDPDSLPEDRPGLLVNLTHFEDGVHAGMECVDCHTGLEDLPHAEELPPVNCLECHEDAGEAFGGGVHSTIDATKVFGHANGIRCIDCHGTHDIYPSDDERSRTTPLNVVNLCSKCHDQDTEGTGSESRKFHTGNEYKKSVHYFELRKGNPKAPTCTTCHGHHDIHPRKSPLDTPGTCGQCHKEITETYLGSVHGKSLMEGYIEAPACTTCHGSHEVLGATNPISLTAPHRLSRGICSQCHGSTLLAGKFGFSDQQPDTYFDSYHGKAGDIGGIETANCASCHGVHNIYDDADERSMINQVNLEHTCQQCHLDAGPNFVMGKIHTSSRHPTDPIAAFIRTLYFWFIGLTIAFMITHNVLIFVRHLWDKIQHEKNRPRVRRFSVSQMIQHHLVAIGFIILAVTGFALAYPESTYTHLLESFGLSEHPRQVIHRAAGVVLTVTFGAHLLGLLLTRGGRRELRYIVMGWQDVKDLYGNLAFVFFRRKSPPKVGRYAYWEKMEYWALIWGMILMALTGFTLWFPTWVTQYVPRLIIDIAGIIHFYEAVLASLAILYWHLFFVVYHPTEYPLALSMFNGQVTVEELKKHRPLEYEDLVRDGKIPPEAMVPEEESEDPDSGQNQDTV